MRRIAQDFCRKTRSKNRRALAGRKIFYDASIAAKRQARRRITMLVE
jgi:hypothetical protein